MLIIGCDLHSRYQFIATLNTETGEIRTRRLEHENGEARAFYAGLAKRALIGIEAMGYTQWFERMVAELGQELWMGDPAEIRAREAAAAEDGRTGRGALAGPAGAGSVSADLGAERGRTRRPAVAEVSEQAGADADVD